MTLRDELYRAIMDARAAAVASGGRPISTEAIVDIVLEILARRERER